jgi:hypothetical protein
MSRNGTAGRDTGDFFEDMMWTLLIEEFSRLEAGEARPA